MPPSRTRSTRTCARRTARGRTGWSPARVPSTCRYDKSRGKKGGEKNDSAWSFRRRGEALARIIHTEHETTTACSRRREEADSFARLAHPPPHVGGYDAYEIRRLVQVTTLESNSGCLCKVTARIGWDGEGGVVVWTHERL